MTGPLLDTNVLVYVYDAADVRKQQIAFGIVDRLARE